MKWIRIYETDTKIEVYDKIDLQLANLCKAPNQELFSRFADLVKQVNYWEHKNNHDII